MSSASTAVNNKPKTYDDIRLRVPRGRKTDLDAFCKERGQSINGLINEYLRDAMGFTEAQWRSHPNEDTIAAMEEAERIALDPSVKGYTDLDELFRELKA